MTAPVLNLLRYPRRDLGGSPGVWRSLALAWCVGMGLGGLWVAGQQGRLQALQGQHRTLHAQVLRLEEEQATLRVQQRQGQQLRQAQARVQDWQARQMQLLKWQDVLEAHGQTMGLRVVRWQSDGRQLELQAWLPQAQDVPALLAALSSAGPQAWSLQSLSGNTQPGSSGHGQGVELLLQAPGATLVASSIALPARALP